MAGTQTVHQIKTTLTLYRYLWLPFLVALLFRLLYAGLRIPDFWGDSYHNWYISWSILEHDWVYSDYKGRELVWLPFYRYIVAGLMAVFKSNGLMLGHVFNILVGSVTASYTAFFVQTFRGKTMGLIAGLIMAALPWHIAYSAMNLPNIFGGLLVLILVMQAYKSNWALVVLLTAISVLTRYELTFILMMFGVFSLIRRDWKLSGSLLTGALIGLGIWSWWSFHKTGDPLFWLTAKSAGLSWDALFQMQTYGQQRSWYFPIFSMIQSFPLLLFFLIPGSIKKQRKHWKLYTPILLAGAHWVFMLISQFQYFSQADPRYYIISLPLAVVGFSLIWNVEEFNTRWINRALSLFIVLVFVIQMFAFRYVSYTWTKFIQVGEYLEELQPDGNLWIDEPSIIYYADIDPARAFSSDQLAPSNSDYEMGVAHNLQAQNIHYIVAFEASYSKTLWIWPKMKNDEPITWNGFEFSLMYRSEPHQNTEQTKPGELRTWIEEIKGPVSVWKVEQQDQVK
ncbi:MAG TPA: hypothetical protein DEQ34_04265 [Balneolaceae bacterium]|nr:hypothetical protein [Balneolaceae bacterium]|tara:strand:- start:86123 stop:87649 length:1527 start_codon:yes stop_codon:yes gene_type:complete